MCPRLQGITCIASVHMCCPDGIGQEGWGEWEGRGPEDWLARIKREEALTEVSPLYG